VSPKLQAYFKDYDAYHSTTGNEVCHYFGIPFIVVSLLGLLSAWVIDSGSIFGSPLLRVDGGLILWALASLWYLFLDWKMGLSFSFVVLGGYFFGRTLPGGALWALFVFGWVLQGIGHAKYEKKSPAFFRNVTHLMIGPLWIFAKITGIRAESDGSVCASNTPSRGSKILKSR
jgi:uncharacterized membrane protein YGL010W